MSVPSLPASLDWSRARGDLALSFGGQLFTKLVNYAVLAVLARHLSQESFGRFLYAAATASMFVLLTDPGTRRYLLREVATTPSQAVGRLAEVLSIRLPLYLPYFLLLGAFAVLLRPGLVAVLLISGLYVGLRGLWGSIDALLLGLRRVRTSVVASAGGRLILLILVVALVAGGAGLTGLLWAHVIAYGFLFLLGLALVRALVGPLGGVRRPAGLGMVVRAAVPFFLIDALEIVHFKLDTVMLGFFRPYAEVALYEGSARLLEASQFVMRPLMAVFLPVCTAMAVEEEWPELAALVRWLLRWAAVLGALIAGIVFLVASLALTVVYGRGFEAATPLLRVLSLATPLVYLSFVSLFVGNALRLERRAVVLLFGSVAVNAALNLFLIPRLGGLGAALTTVVTYALLAVLLVRLNLALLRDRRSRAPVPDQRG